MPLGARFPVPGVVLPGRLGGQREDREIGCVAKLLLGIAADETDESNSVEVLLHTFLLFCPSVSGTRKRVGARLPRQVAAFLGGPKTGEPEPEWCRRQSRSCAGAGRRKSPEAVPRQRVGQGTCPNWITGRWAAAEEAAHSKIVDSQSPSAWKSTTA